MIQNRLDPAPDAEPGLVGLRPLNFALLGAGGVSVVTGYLLLDAGSTVAAPLLLMLGYAVLVPAGLLVGLRRSGAGSALGTNDRGE